MAMDQYLLIPFLGEWTSINPSYFDVHQGYKVLTHPQISQGIIACVRCGDLTMQTQTHCEMSSFAYHIFAYATVEGDGAKK